MAYVLGVDLGTTYTAAATLDDGAPTMLGLGNRAMQVPSVVYLQPDGTMLFGEAAERRGAADPTRIAREFKRRIGDPVPIMLAGTPYSAEMLTAKLLRWVVDQASERLGRPPAALTLTHPANWNRFKLDLLWQAAGMAGLVAGPGMPAVTLCPEPVAAAIHYATRNRVSEGERICVYDLGGGTFDVCVLAREGANTGGGFRIVGPPGGVEHLGGIDFDEAVFRRVLGEIEQDPQARALLAEPASLARVRRDCTEAKEALSADTDTVISVALSGTSRSVRLTRGEFEDMIRPALAETISATNSAFQAAGVGPADISTFVLVGGSSRIPLVAELLTAEFHRPVARDTHPKHEVALGAAIATDRSFDRPAEAPAAYTPAQPTDQASINQQIRGKRSGPSSPRRMWIMAGSLAAVAAIGIAATVFTLTSDSNGSADNSATPSTEQTESPTSANVGSTTADSVTLGVTGLIDLPRSEQPLPIEVVISPRIIDGSLDGALVDYRNGQTVGRIHVPGGEMFAPTISPDRRSIIYVDKPTRMLHVIAADGSGDRPLFRGLPDCDERMLRPGWNPRDPDQIALACIDSAGKYKLRIVRVDGEVVRELDVGQTVVDDLAYSPDGSSVTFWAGPSAVWPDGGALYTMDSDGSEPPTKITDGTTDADPIFSPDGARILFRRVVEDSPNHRNMDLFVINADGTGLQVLAPHPGDDLDPSWSPDGATIVFTSNRGDGPNDTGFNHHLLMSADGQNVRRLAPENPFPEELPTAWGNR